ncbi:MAG: RtcB family protein [Vampirovibrionales bacterium]|nr:RtcB family protein [Vampirovibrionales bacterium]
MNYEYIQAGQAGIKAWVKGVEFDEATQTQLMHLAKLPFIFKHVAAMPDCHLGKGATVGSVIATRSAIIPAAVGVDIGCGMVAQKTSLHANDLADDLKPLRLAIEAAVPIGFNQHVDAAHVVGAELDAFTERYQDNIKHLLEQYLVVKDASQPIDMLRQLGTLGGGNHFIELCLDEQDNVWIMLHSGSRGGGNKIGSRFIEAARKDMERHFLHLPDVNLAYLTEGTPNFDAYVQAVHWAQSYAALNRKLMIKAVLQVLKQAFPRLLVTVEAEKAINCHHNYVQQEYHFGCEVIVTRKGAVSAKTGELGIIPGSMGAKSYIVRGKGNPESFHSCAHGAGRRMSRSEAKKTFTLEDHAAAMQGVECRLDKDVLDETPAAYKDIDAVMQAQQDLVEVVHTLKQVLCIKG